MQEALRIPWSADKFTVGWASGRTCSGPFPGRNPSQPRTCRVAAAESRHGNHCDHHHDHHDRHPDPAPTTSDHYYNGLKSYCCCCREDENGHRENRDQRVRLGNRGPHRRDGAAKSAVLLLLSSPRLQSSDSGTYQAREEGHC